MLKNIFILSIFLFSFQSLACWKIEGKVAVDGEEYKIHQKVDHDKEYIMPMGPYIFKMTVTKGKDKQHKFKYVLQEKKGTTLTLVTHGEDEVREDHRKEIYSKGEEDQPHSIMTIKLLHI